MMFQSPKSGKFESNTENFGQNVHGNLFQSPKSGKFESNELVYRELVAGILGQFQSPKSGKFESNSVSDSG